MDTNKLEQCLITIIKLRRFTPTGAVTASQFTIEGVVDINTLFRSSNSIKERAWPQQSHCLSESGQGSATRAPTLARGGLWSFLLRGELELDGRLNHDHGTICRAFIVTVLAHICTLRAREPS